MKTLHSLFTLSLIVLFHSIGFAQLTPAKKPNENKLKPNIKEIKAWSPKDLKKSNKIPHLRIGNLGAGKDLSNVGINQDDKQALIVPRSIVPIDMSPVNGTITARSMFISSDAFLDSYFNVHKQRLNQISCDCEETDESLLILRMDVEADKRYLVTITASPKDGYVRVLASSAGVYHYAVITDPEEEIDVMVSSETSGKIRLILSCTDDPSFDSGWVFHSLTITEIE